MRLTNKELGELIADAEEQGWVVGRRTNGHLKWVSPKGEVVFSSSSPSDPRAVSNIKRDLFRYGLIKLERKGKKKTWM
jgi:hypothetical protein